MEDRAPSTLAVAFPSVSARPVTGHVEFSVAEALGPGRSRPAQVTGVLAAVFDRIGGVASDIEDVRSLSSGSREWLLQRAASQFWIGSGWFSATCPACDTAFDVPAALTDAPRKPAGDGFPVVLVETSLGQRRFEAPNGRHEEQLAQAADDPVRTLIGACGLSPTATEDARAFTEADLVRIEDALDRASPEVADRVSTSCPSCSSVTEVRLDPLAFAFPKARQILMEVHTIAKAYHWSEAEVLALPSSRRRAYCGMIRHEGGGR